MVWQRRSIIFATVILIALALDVLLILYLLEQPLSFASAISLCVALTAALTIIVICFSGLIFKKWQGFGDTAQGLPPSPRSSHLSLPRTSISGAEGQAEDRVRGDCDPGSDPCPAFRSDQRSCRNSDTGDEQRPPASRVEMHYGRYVSAYCRQTAGPQPGRAGGNAAGANSREDCISSQIRSGLLEAGGGPQRSSS